MKQKIYQLTTLLLMLVCSIGGMQAANTVTLPASNMSFSNAVIVGCKVQKDVTQVGSTKANSTMTFSLNNPTQQDYILSLKSGENSCSAVYNIKITNSAEGEVFNQDFTASQTSTSAWTPSESHTFNITNLAVGNYTMVITAKSTTANSGNGYAGNLGYLCINAISDYDQVPGTINLLKGTLTGKIKVEYTDKNQTTFQDVGYITNGGTASYAFYNKTPGNYNMLMGIKIISGGTMNVKITDLESGTIECTTDYTITGDKSNSYTINTLSIPSLSKGVKNLLLTFTNSSDYICNYNSIEFQHVNSTVTTGATGWATGCIPYDATVPSDCKAYYISGATSDKVTLTELTSIPAGEGFILNAATGNHSFDVASSTPAAITNLLVGTTKETTVKENETYVLGKIDDNNTTVGMMLYTGTTIAANHAYLPKSSVPSSASALQMSIDDVVTGISNAQLPAARQSDAIYNLQGQRVAVPQAGRLYINNGKKYIQK